MQVTATDSNSFVALAITKGFTNPLQAFQLQREILDFSDENLWMFLTIKAFEQNSNCRLLAKYLISEGIVPINEIILQVATLNYLQIAPVKAEYDEQISKINSLIKDTEIKITNKSPIVEEMMDLDNFVFNSCSQEQLQQIYNYLEERNLLSLSKHIKQLDVLVN